MEKMKSFNVKIPKELWQFVKSQAAHQEKSMYVIIEELIRKEKKRVEKRLTSD